MTERLTPVEPRSDDDAPCDLCKAAIAVACDEGGTLYCAPCAQGETEAQRVEGFLGPDQTITGIKGL